MPGGAENRPNSLPDRKVSHLNVSSRIVATRVSAVRRRVCACALQGIPAAASRMSPLHGGALTPTPPTQPVAGEGGWLETASGEKGKPSERSVRSAAALRLQVLCSHAAVSAPVVFSTNPSPPHLPSVTPYPSLPPPPPFVVKTLHSSRCHRLHEIPCKCRAFCCCCCNTVLRTCLRRTLLEPRPPPPTRRPVLPGSRPVVVSRF